MPVHYVEQLLVGVKNSEQSSLPAMASSLLGGNLSCLCITLNSY